MTLRRWFLSVSLMLASACGNSANTCGPSNCAGCCAGDTCELGNTQSACGAQGATCNACSFGNTCTAGQCFVNNNGGGSGATGGGSGALGGGTASTGGGSTTTGGGDGVTGGGSTTTGGGSGSTGGGTATTGGGDGSLGGGTASTGGGSAGIGGGDGSTGGGSTTTGGGSGSTGGGSATTGGGSGSTGGGAASTGGGTGATDDVCAGARVLQDSVTVSASTIGYAKDFTEGVQCTVSNGPDAFFAIEVPADYQLRVTVTPQGAATDTVINIADACASFTQCNATGDTGAAGQPDLAIYRNFGAAKTVFIIVSSKTAATAAPFQIVGALSANATGDVCESAPTLNLLPVGQTGQIQYTTEYAFADINTGFGSGCPSAITMDSREVAFAINLDAGRTLTATVAPTANWDAAIYFVPAPASNCLPQYTACIDSHGGDSYGAYQVESISHHNGTTGTETLFVVVDAHYTNQYGAFTLQLRQD